MTRQAFMARLREGLAGLPPQTQAEILADYEAHFAEGEAAGRPEAEVAAALGDPTRLARELRAEAGRKRWETERNASSATAAVFAVLGLGALDIIFLLPILMGIAGAMVGIGVAIVAVFFAGGALFAAGPFADLPGGPGAALLGGGRKMMSMSAWFTWMGAIVAIAIGWVASLGTRALSRYREFAADAGSVALTGSAAALASALMKVSDGIASIPERDLRLEAARDTFHLLPVARDGDDRFHLPATHPSLEARIARLEKLEHALQRSR